MNIVKIICLVIWVSCLSCVLGTFLPEWLARGSDSTIRIEAVEPSAVHPISGVFSTDFLLVEIWTWTEIEGFEVAVPHIVRMERSEYIEYMNQPADR